MALNIDFDQLHSDADWAGALAEIMVHTARETESTEEEMDELSAVLDEYQEKLPTRTSVEPLLEIASEMSTVLMINIINDSLNRINRRNRELNALAQRLGVQVRHINNSANLLQNIRRQVERATAVVRTAKQVAEAATNPDTSKIEKLGAIITALEGLQDIFE